MYQETTGIESQDLKTHFQGWKNWWTGKYLRSLQKWNRHWLHQLHVNSLILVKKEINFCTKSRWTFHVFDSFLRTFSYWDLPRCFAVSNEAQWKHGWHASQKYQLYGWESWQTPGFWNMLEGNFHYRISFQKTIHEFYICF